jgi:sortase (surface protein transpeptidase)
LHVTGELMITLGLVVLLFVFYQLYVTNWFAAGRQRDATQALENQWTNKRGELLDPVDGKGFARLYIPALGADYQFTIIQGTNAQDLAIGPGHYKDTAMPGKPGNFSVAGHRVGKGAPFNDLDLVKSCDAMVVETKSDWFVYRTLPMADEMSGWSSGRGRKPLCAGGHGTSPVKPLGGQYKGVPGQQIVLPSQSEVIEPVPGKPGVKATAALMTLTTCNPQFSDRQRLIVHGVLVKQYPKSTGDKNQLPPELTETT